MFFNHLRHINKMQFEEIRITTSTAIFDFKGKLDRGNVYRLFPLYITDHEPIRTPRTKKIILPVYEEKNKVIVVKSGRDYRSQFEIVTGCFPNGTELIISTGENNLGVKLSRKRLHITGVKDIEKVKECVEYILKSIIKIQNRLLILNENMDMAKNIYDWLVKNTKGEKIGKKNLLKRPPNPANYFEGDQLEIAKLFVKYISEGMLDVNKYQEIYLAKIRWIMRVSFICCGSLKIRQISYQMRNYSFNIGFLIDKRKLRNVFSKREYIYARFDNMVDNCVEIRIQHPDTLSPGRKGYFHTFRIHTSGEVVQSSKIETEAEDIYYTFINIVKDYSHKMKLIGRSIIE